MKSVDLTDGLFCFFVVIVDGDSSGLEYVSVPTTPSRTLHTALRAASKVFHTSFLSTDTFHTPTYPLMTEGGPSEARAGGGRRGECLSELSRQWVYADTLEVVVRELTSRHGVLYEGLHQDGGGGGEEGEEHTPLRATSSNGVDEKHTQLQHGHDNQAVQAGVLALLEEYCLQVIFDLQLCQATLLPPKQPLTARDGSPGGVGGVLDGGGREALEECRLLYAENIDPINTHLLVPLLMEEITDFMRGAHLLLPCGGGGAGGGGGTLTGVDKDDDTASPTAPVVTSVSVMAKSECEQWMQTLFPAAPSAGDNFTTGTTTPSTGGGPGGNKSAKVTPVSTRYVWLCIVC